MFVTDLQRGVDVQRFDGPARTARTVSAPRVRARRTGLRFARDAFGGLCPLAPPAA